MNLTDYIKKQALALGFDACGICGAESLAEHETVYSEYIERGYAGEMQYLQRNLDKRLNPANLHEGTVSVVVLALNYYPERAQRKDSYHIAKYAYGEDYHHVMKKKIYALLSMIQGQVSTVDGRAFVDSAPVMERLLGRKAGLGWIGKNGLLLSPSLGSYFFLGELYLNLPLETETTQIKNRCGRCTRCIDACPTQAIVQAGVVDARKCISYLSIEKKTALSSAEQACLGDWIYGCDICQDVCPWNQGCVATRELAFSPDERLLNYTTADWKDLDEGTYREIFKRSAVKRKKYKGLFEIISSKK